MFLIISFGRCLELKPWEWYIRKVCFDWYTKLSHCLSNNTLIFIHTCCTAQRTVWSWLQSYQYSLQLYLPDKAFKFGRPYPVLPQVLMQVLPQGPGIVPAGSKNVAQLIAWGSTVCEVVQVIGSTLYYREVCHSMPCGHMTSSYWAVPALVSTYYFKFICNLSFSMLPLNMN